MSRVLVIRGADFSDSSIEKITIGEIVKTITDYSDFELSQGFINNTARDTQPVGYIDTSFTGTEVTGYIPVKVGYKVTYSGNGGDSTWCCICGYASKDSLEGTTPLLINNSTTSLVDKVVTIPTGVNFIRAAARNSRSAKFDGTSLKLMVKTA